MKKILSVLLALAMTVSLLVGAGITVLADGEEILYEVFLEGELPDIEAGETPTAVQLFDTSGRFTAVTRWLDDEDNAFSEAFEDGKIYWLEVTLTANDGFLFGEGESVSAFVNYMWIDWAESSSDQTQTVFKIRFSLLPTVTVVEIDGVTEPVLGETPTIDGITVPDGANYYIDLDSAYWWDERTGEIQEDEFGISVYYLYLEIYPEANYDISDDVELYINGEQSYDFGSEALRLWTYPTYSLCEEITEIEIDFEQPSVGDTPSEDYLSVSDDVGYEIGEVEWYIDNLGASEPTEDDFEKQNYSVQAQVYTKDGYSFADDLDIYINGEYQQSIGGQHDRATVSIFFSLCDMIETIDLSGVADAVLGEEATTEDITIPDNCGYTISSATWYKGGIFGADEFEGEFTKAMYSLEIILEAEAGSQFSQEATVTVNGEEIQDYNVNGSEAYVYIYYSLCDAVAEVELPEFPEITVDEDIELSDQAVLETEEYEVYGIWHILNEYGYFEEFEGTVEDGNIYAYYFYVLAKEGYEFTEDTVYTVEGENIDELYSSQMDVMFEVRKTYNLSDLEEITSVNITLSKPEIDEDIDSEAYEIDEDANYSVDFTEWWVADTEDSYDFVPASGDKFEEGKYYFFEMQLSADEGYFFADNVVIKINGKQVKDAEGLSMIGTFVEPGYVYIMEPFGELTADEPLDEEDEKEDQNKEEDKDQNNDSENRQEAVDKEDTIVQTGDNFLMTPYLVALIISLSAIVLATVRIRKKQK